jgi:hypothetical protein
MSNYFASLTHTAVIYAQEGSEMQTEGSVRGMLSYVGWMVWVVWGVICWDDKHCLNGLCG